MNKVRIFLCGGAAALGLFALSSTSYALSDDDVEVNSPPGASVDIEQHRGILPRNRGTEVHVDTPAPDVEATVPPPPAPGGDTVVEHSETRTIHQD